MTETSLSTTEIRMFPCHNKSAKHDKQTKTQTKTDKQRHKQRQIKRTLDTNIFFFDFFFFTNKRIRLICIEYWPNQCNLCQMQTRFVFLSHLSFPSISAIFYELHAGKIPGNYLRMSGSHNKSTSYLHLSFILFYIQVRCQRDICLFDCAW